MTDLEDALRGTLQARADAADREPALLPGLERRISRARRRRLLGSALAVTAVAAAAITGVSLTTATSPHPEPSRNVTAPTPHRGVPLTDVGRTPHGWAPVPYLGAQISVPTSWFIESSYSSICGGHVRGMVFLGATKTPGGCGPLPANVVRLLPAGPGASALVPRALQPVALGPSGMDWATRGYGVKVVAIGPLAGRVVRTLTRSPLSVVLARGPAFAVPRGWQWHEFGGLRFATPPSWAVQRYNSWAGCGFNIAARIVWLNDAKKFSVASCPGTLATAGGMAANPGVEVSAGRYGAAGFSSTTVGCRMAGGARLCVLPPQNGNWGMLQVLAQVPGQRWPVLVQLGLAGSGATARTIFDSIRAG